MKIKNKILLSGISAIIISVLTIGSVFASEKYVYKSQGKIVFDNGTEDTSDDVIFDANDLKTLDTTVADGKKNLALKVNEKTGEETVSVDANFSDLVTSMDKVFSAGEKIAWKSIATDSELTEREELYSEVIDLNTLKTAIDADNKNSTVIDLSNCSLESSGTTYTYPVYNYYKDWASLDGNNFIVGYKNIPNFSQKGGGYAIEGHYGVNLNVAIGKPYISYNKSTGVLTISNVLASASCSGGPNDGFSLTSSSNITSDNLIVILCTSK